MARLSCGQSEAVTRHTSEGRPGCSCRVAGAFEESNHRQRLSPEGAAARGLRARPAGVCPACCAPASLRSHLEGAAVCVHQLRREG